MDSIRSLLSMIVLKGSDLTQLPVTLVGDWYPEARRWRWEGVAEAAEPLVGLVLCEQPGLVQLSICE